MKFDNKNVLVTGGNGMIGRQLVELLYDTTSANITVADLPNVDLRDRKDCKSVCEGQDIVFHLELWPKVKNIEKKLSID